MTTVMSERESASSLRENFEVDSGLRDMYVLHICETSGDTVLLSHRAWNYPGPIRGSVLLRPVFNIGVRIVSNSRVVLRINDRADEITLVRHEVLLFHLLLGR